MIGTQPTLARVPRDYSMALDAAYSMCGGHMPAVVCCDVAPLAEELHQRTPDYDIHQSIHILASCEQTASVAVWVEPLCHSWQPTLTILHNICFRISLLHKLVEPCRLLVITALPLARILPERQHWCGEPRGITARGVWQLWRGIHRAGFRIADVYTFHPLTAVAMSRVSTICALYGADALADQLTHATQQLYCATGLPMIPISTVALLVCEHTV